MKKRKLYRQIKTIIFILIFGIMIVTGCIRKDIEKIVFNEHLDETVFSIDGEEISLNDMAFYIAYEENIVQQQAMEYDSKNPRHYWETYINGDFVCNMARDAALNMAIRDKLYSMIALKEGITLDREESITLKQTTLNQYNLLTEREVEALGIDKEELYVIMYRIALSEKMIQKLSKEKDIILPAFNPGGSAYEEELLKHELKVNDTFWKQVDIGRITVNQENND